MEHIIDNTTQNNEIPADTQNANNKNNSTTKILTKEEREALLFNNYKKAFGKTLEILTLNKAITETNNNKDNNNDNISSIEDDNISLASSKLFSVGNRAYKNSKLPVIYGSKEFITLKYLGIGEENASDLSNNTTNNKISNQNKNNLTADNQKVEINSSNNNIIDANKKNLQNNPNNNLIENNQNITNNNNPLNYDQNYDYNNVRPSNVSELFRPNFNQILEEEIKLGLNKKTSMEFNLQNQNNTINFIRNQPQLNTNTDENEDMFNEQNQVQNVVLSNPRGLQETNMRNKRRVVINGKIPKVPYIPPDQLARTRKTKIPTIPTQTINNLNLGSISLKKTDKTENNNNGNNTNINQVNALNTQAENSKPMSFKESLGQMMSGRGVGMMRNTTSQSAITNNINNNNLNQNNQNNTNSKLIDNNNNNSNSNNQEANRISSISNNSSGNIFNKDQHLNAIGKQKSITLNNFVKKSTLFDVEEDDEEDNTGLFKRSTTTNINWSLNKSSTSNNNNSNKLPQEIINKNDKNINKEDMGTNQNSNEKKSKNIFSEENPENEKSNSNKKNPINNQKSILKNKGFQSIFLTI